MRNFILRSIFVFCALAIPSLYAGAALGEVVAIVSARNLNTVISKEQLVDIFLGKTNRFPNGDAALPIDLADGSDTRAEFYSTFANRSTAQIRTHWSKIIFTGRGQPPQEAASSAELKKMIVENPNAIGYIDRKLVDSSVKVVTLN